MTSQFKFFSKGIVAEDYQPNIGGKYNGKGYIKVFAEELHVTSKVTLGDSPTEVVEVNSLNHSKKASKLTKTTNLDARWLNLSGDNRTTPYVKMGEDVMIFTFGESDEKYWTTLFTELDLRKRETVLHMYGNQGNFGEASDLNNSYWKLIDTVGKIVQFHTSANDGEACGYDFLLDTKNGTYNFEDTLGNKFYLESVKQTLTVDIKVLNLNIETININGKTINVKGSALNIDEKTVDLNASAFTIGGGAVTLNSTLLLNKSSNFGGPVTMNNNAKTTTGPHAHIHTIL